MAYPQWWHLTVKVNGLPLSTSCAAVLGITTAICHDPRPLTKLPSIYLCHGEVWLAIDSNTTLAHRDTEI